MNKTKPLILAHRGGMLNALENTLSAFNIAFKNGADGIECDVRITKDSEFVVFHDKNTRRLTGANFEISETHYFEIKNLRVMGKERIPHLDEILDFLQKYPDKICFFEIGFGTQEQVVKLAQKLKEAGLCPRSFILAFSNKKNLLNCAKEAVPETRISVMPILPVNIVGTANDSSADSLCVGWIDWPGTKQIFLMSTRMFNFKKSVEKAQKLNIQVTGGVANTPDEVRLFKNFGVDGIWTDDVPMAIKTVAGAESYD